MCALSLAFLNSNSVLLLTTSCLNSMNSFIRSFILSTLGRPLISATLLVPKEVCRSVCLYRWLMITCATASFLRSTTILVPSLLLLSLFTSDTPSITLSETRWPIFSVSTSRLTWYGTSVIMIFSLPVLVVSMFTLPRSTTLPLPKCNPALTPSYPKMIPPVGKSGALTIFIRSSMVMSLLSIYAKQASTTSLKLWGSILVAIPTAIPLDPLTSSCGIRVGRTVGSLVVSS